MSQFKSCIIVLKPTSFFSSFIAEQLTPYDCPDANNLPFDDHTAYIIPACDNDEALLGHLERLFPFMFRHEVVRVLGAELADRVHADFLDFLYCFKFEVYEHSVLMESSLDDCQQLICVKPRSIDLEWMPPISEDQIEVRGLLENINLSPTSQTASILVKTFDRLTDLKPFLQCYCKPILKQDLKTKTAQLIQWPSPSSAQTLHHYFAVEVHTQLVHLH